MNRSCRACGLVYDRGEDGYLVGAYMFNIIIAELLFAAGFVGVLAATWPNPPWDLLTWAGPMLIITFPVICYPFSKTLFLAFDLFFNPAESGSE